MASRYYLPSSGDAPVSPAIDASWQANTASPSRLTMVTTKSNTARVSSGNISRGTAGGTTNTFFRQYVSDPIGAQTISGTVTGLILSQESHADANANGQLVVKVVSGDGATVRGVLLAAATTTTVSNEIAAILTARLWPGSGGTLTPVAALNGDRLVIEIGTRIHQTNTTDYTTLLWFGDNQASDLAAVGNGNINNPWMEFSADILPAGAGAGRTFWSRSQVVE